MKAKSNYTSCSIVDLDANGSNLVNGKTSTDCKASILLGKNLEERMGCELLVHKAELEEVLASYILVGY